MTQEIEVTFYGIAHLKRFFFCKIQSTAFNRKIKLVENLSYTLDFRSGHGIIYKNLRKFSWCVGDKFNISHLLTFHRTKRGNLMLMFYSITLKTISIKTKKEKKIKIKQKLDEIFIKRKRTWSKVLRLNYHSSLYVDGIVTKSAFLTDSTNTSNSQLKWKLTTRLRFNVSEQKIER